MTSVSIVQPTPFSGNPIDLVEEIVIANDWRMTGPARRSWLSRFPAAGALTTLFRVAGGSARCTSPVGLT